MSSTHLRLVPGLGLPPRTLSLCCFLLPTGWLKSLRAGYSSEGECGMSLGSGEGHMDVCSLHRGRGRSISYQGCSLLASHHSCPMEWVGAWGTEQGVRTLL